MSMIDDASDETVDALKQQRERRQRDEDAAAEASTGAGHGDPEHGEFGSAGKPGDDSLPDDDEMSGNVPTANLE